MCCFCSLEGSESSRDKSGEQSQGFAGGSEAQKCDDMEDLHHPSVARLSDARSVATEASRTADFIIAVQVVMCSRQNLAFDETTLHARILPAFTVRSSTPLWVSSPSLPTQAPPRPEER
jgi:hypothetical protein